MIFTTNVDEAKKYLRMGFDAVANSMDSILFMKVYQEMMKGIRGSTSLNGAVEI